MSDSSARLADLDRRGAGPLTTRRRALRVFGRALLAATLIPALRLRAETAPAALNAIKPVFDAGSLAEVLRLLDASPVPSDDISLIVPDFVENGALVPVEITSRVPGAQQIYIISEANPFPLVARFSVPDGTEAFVDTHQGREQLQRACAGSDRRSLPFGRESHDGHGGRLRCLIRSVSAPRRRTAARTFTC